MSVYSVLSRLDRVVRFFETALLTLLLVAMIGLAVTQITLRNSGGGLVWGDELLRIMVLWLALLGAVTASRDDNHITIDLLPRTMPAKYRLLLKSVADLFTLSVSATLAYHGARFVATSAEYGDTILGGMDAWIFQTAIPLGFGLVALRYAVHFINRLRKLQPEVEAR